MARSAGDDIEEVVLAEERLSRARFIRLGAALGVGAAGASAIAACGGGEDAGGGEEAPPSEEPTQATDKEYGEAAGGDPGSIASESDVPVDSAVEFTGDSGQPAVLVHLDSGDFVAYSAICTHQQCKVAYRDGQLACPCHGSVYDPANGAEVLTGPAPQPLAEIPVEVRDGQVFRA